MAGVAPLANGQLVCRSDVWAPSRREIDIVPWRCRLAPRRRRSTWLAMAGERASEGV